MEKKLMILMLEILLKDGTISEEVFRKTIEKINKLTIK